MPLLVDLCKVYIHLVIIRVMHMRWTFTFSGHEDMNTYGGHSEECTSGGHLGVITLVPHLVSNSFR
jgi:hypothetical protein